MKSEIFFLKYAFPCSFIIKQRGEITQEEYDFLEKSAIKGESLEKDFLEKVYWRAFKKIRTLGDPWNIDILKKYFHEKHNDMIEAKGVLKDLCMIQSGVVERIEDDVAVVNLPTGKRPVMSLAGKLKVGDEVRVHYGYAVEKI